MPNMIVFANKQKAAVKAAAVALQKQKAKAAVKAAAVKAAAVKAAAVKANAVKATAVKATAVTLQKQKVAATVLQKQYKTPNPTQLIISPHADYISVPGIVFNQNAVSGLNRINVSVSSDYVPAI